MDSSSPKKIYIRPEPKPDLCNGLKKSMPLLVKKVNLVKYNASLKSVSNEVKNV